MAWLYIVIAAAFEAAWTFSVKFMKFSEIKNLRFATFYKMSGGLPVILPILGYIVFGVCNIYFFSLAIKQLPTATAYAVWTGIGAVGTVLVGILVFKEPATFLRLLFITTLIGSIIGLKAVSH